MYKKTFNVLRNQPSTNLNVVQSSELFYPYGNHFFPLIDVIVCVFLLFIIPIFFFAGMYDFAYGSDIQVK